MSTTNTLKLTIVLIIATILIVGVGAVDVGAQEVTKADITDLKADITDLKADITDNTNTRFTTLYWIVGAVLVVMILVMGWVFMLHGKISEIIGSFNMLQDKVKIKMGKVSSTKIKNIDTKSVVQSNSPRQLTYIGHAVLDESGGKAYLDGYTTELYKEFEGIKTAWEIERKAFDIMNKRISDPSFQSINKYVYYKGISIDVVVLVMSIELRDRVINNYNISMREKVKKQEV